MNQIRKLLSLLLVIALMLSIAPLAFASRETRVISVPEGTYLISQTDYRLTSGVTESQIILNDATGSNQTMGFVTEVKPNAQVTFKASYVGYYTPGSTAASRAEKAKSLPYGMQRTTDQAKAFEDATGEKVIFATNGDYYNMQTAQPLGYLIMEGNVVQTGNGLAQEPYFAVLKDGSYAIRDYGTDHSDVAEAISGPFYLVKNGVNALSPDDTILAPRNSIGLKADGTLVTFLADGRQAPYSVGMSCYETAELLISLGCVNAIYLDGGGSATYASVHEGTEELLVRNSPSDGPERTVASALLMISTAIADGSFDHAALSPNNKVYTPGSSVQFSAVGVDAAGGAAELPSNLTWSVPAAAGTITGNGLFTARAGYTGTVEVSLMRGGNVVGTTSIAIADIDNLYFTGESISLDFDSDSDLGLNARYQRRAIEFKEGDFTWTVRSTTEGVSDAAFGTMNGNIFHTGNSDSTITGEVTVQYTCLDGKTLTDTISVEIGKMPVVIQDFEPNDNGPLTAAHFHWGKESYYQEGSPYGNGYVGNHPELNVITGGTYSGAPTYTTLTAPYRFTGNYDSAVPAAPIFNANGYSYYLWPNGTITEYEAGEVKIMTRDAGAQVRSGDYALELDYDYASYDGSANANFYVRYCGEEISIDGYPTEIGLWVYAPEGTANYALALDVAVWNGSGYSTSNRWLTTAAGTTLGSEAGIDWTGWMYCYTNIEDLWPSISAEHPLKIRQGEGLLWLSYQPGKNLGGRFNGTLYFDDYRVVYGTNLDDLVNPTIDALTLNGTEIAADGSTVITTQSVEIAAAFTDPESKNRTGIDPSRTTIFIDGKSIAADGDTAQATTRTTLGNGRHTVTVQVSDGDGNTASATRAFQVNDTSATNASISIETDAAVTLGGTFTMEVKANGAVGEFDLTMLNINSDFGTPTVTFADGVTGESEYTVTGFRKASLTLKGTTAPKAGTLATITFNIPTDIDPEVDFFTYQVTNITFKDATGNEGTGAYALDRLTVTAYYRAELGTMVVGRSCEIMVYDIDGKPAANVKVFLNGTEIGATGADGKLTTDAMAALPEQTEFIVTASSELGISFETKGTVLGFAGNADALPTAIRHTTVDDASTMRTIAWFANPQYARDKAYIQYMTEAEYNAIKRGPGLDTNYRTVRGESELVSFATSKNAAYVNEVTLTGLTPDTLYYYCVGDGSENGWSAMATFRTAGAETEKTSFFILGDTQLLGNNEQDADAIAALYTILTDIGKRGVDFGLQTGDFIDNGGNYTHYQQILNIFSNGAVGDKPLLTVLGNHEYYGALDGKTANAALKIAQPEYYSVEIGEVYIAIINNAADLNEAAAWLIEDAAKTDCAWKVLSLHQPPYYTNVNGGNEKQHSIIPTAADAAGIDVVFSGHDHSYARTEQLKNGSVVKDGTTYVICGDLGEKSRNLNYAAVDNPAFHFAEVTQEYDALYLIADATEEKLTVTAYNLDGTVIDTFTKEKQNEPIDPPEPPDPPDPPVVQHNYVYNRTTGKLVCSDTGCGEEAPASYTGWAKDSATGKNMYFIGGKYLTDWFTLGSEIYHFDKTTGLEHALTVVEDVKTTCGVRGHKLVECECGESEKLHYENAAGHINKKATAADGSTYYVCTRCGRISIYDLTFVDVLDSDWFAKNVDYVFHRGLFSGRDEMEFDPNTAMTRAEFVTVLWRIAGRPEYDNIHTSAFEDCKTNTWYIAAVNWAAKYEIVKGVDATHFSPYGTITREQIVTILYRYANYIGMDTSATADITVGFVDGGSVSNFAKNAMTWAVAVKLIQGDKEQRISPLGDATRAEVATMIMRFDQMEKPKQASD